MLTKLITTKIIFCILVLNLIKSLDRSKYTRNSIVKTKIKKREKVIGDKSKQDSPEFILFPAKKQLTKVEITFIPRITK